MKDGEEKRKSWANRHPGCFLFLVLVVLPGLALLSLGAYWYLNIPTLIAARLHAQGLPANGEELERWHHPEQDGTEEFVTALDACDALSGKGAGYFYNLDEKTMTAEDRQWLDLFLQDFAKARRSVEHAGKSGFLTLGTSYREANEEWEISAGRYAQYKKMLQLATERGNAQHPNPEQVLTDIRSLYQTDRQLHFFFLGEALLFARDPSLHSMTALLQKPGISPKALREFSQQILTTEDITRRREIFSESIAGTLAYLQTIEDQARKKDRSVGFLRNMPSYYFLIANADQWLCSDALERLYHSSQLPFREARKEMQIEPSTVERYLGSCLPLYEELLRSSMILSALEEYYANSANWLEIGIACTLAADRLEGKPWPGEEGKAVPLTAFPADPFTDQPFQLIRSKDALWILSPGSDLAVSTPLSEFSGEKNPATGDDVVFRLPLAPYEPAAASAPASAPTSIE